MQNITKVTVFELATELLSVDLHNPERSYQWVKSWVCYEKECSGQCDL